MDHEQISFKRYVEFIKNNLNFMILFLGICISYLGDQFNYIAILSLINNNTNIIGFLVYELLSGIIPAIIMPFAGVIADKFDRKKIIPISVFLNGISVIGYVFAYKYSSMIILYITCIIYFSFSNITYIAITAYIPNMVNEKDLLFANTMIDSSYMILWMFGMIIGGIVLIATNIYINLVIDIISFMISCFIFLFLFMKIYIKKREFDCSDDDIEMINNSVDNDDSNIDGDNCNNDKKSFFEQFIDGYNYIMSNKEILYITLYKSISNIAQGIYNILDFHFAFKKFTDNSHDGTKIYTIMIGIAIFCSIILQMTIQKLTGTNIKKLKNYVVYALCLIFLSTIFYSFAFNKYIWITGNILYNCGNTILYVILTTLIQTIVEDKYQGRIQSYSFMIRLVSGSIGSIYISLLYYYNIGSLTIRMTPIVILFLSMVLSYKFHYLKKYDLN